ncbi:MAG TPA: hypothetical protein VGP70_24205 [Actinomadura sp.]|nr:hypothetical protein [Actinomadura sp.]
MTTTTRLPRSRRGGSQGTGTAKPVKPAKPVTSAEPAKPVTSAKPAGPATRARRAPPRPVTPAGRPGRPDRPGRAASPARAAGRGTRAAAPRSQAAQAAQAAPPRAPFVLLVVGLLGGALVSLLLLNTVLAEDAFTLTKLQRGNKQLNQQRQALQEEIAREESPARLAQKAKALGMVQPSRPAFVDARTGRVVGPKVRPAPHAETAASAASGVVAVPGAVVVGDGPTDQAPPVSPAAGEGGPR